MFHHLEGGRRKFNTILSYNQGKRMEKNMDVIELAFGHYCSNGDPLPKHRIEAAEYRGLSTFTQFFLGGQLHHCTGGYLSPQGQVVIEPCTLIKAYTSDAVPHWTHLM